MMRFGIYTLSAGQPVSDIASEKQWMDFGSSMWALPHTRAQARMGV